MQNERVLHFLKMQACGNDYIYWDALDEQLPLDWRTYICRHAPKLCNRHWGIGADGIVVLYRDQTIRMAIYNADGSEGATCGNALRCVAWLLDHRHHIPLPQTIQTASGEVVVEGAQCPAWYSVRFGRLRSLGVHRVRVQGRTYRYYKIDVGNLHAVVADCSLPVERVHEAVCKREGVDINVETYVARQKVLHVQVCERGSGVTMACGSGACAVAYAAQMRGDVDSSPVCVQMTGGKLLVELQDDLARLTGEAEFVFEGRYVFADL